MWAFFGENVCGNERIGSHGEGGVRRKILYVDPAMKIIQLHITRSKRFACIIRLANQFTQIDMDLSKLYN